ncbi:MAG: hypothetical protein H0V19_01670, partial [Euzebyales bacterium]|nr:hypothetical protein [Euzebyales bacterium]
MHTRARVRALGCALLLLLAGCRLQLQVGVDVGPSGGGTLGVRLTADPQLLAEAARAGA